MFICKFAVVVFFHFGFDGGTVVLIAPALCHCSPVTFIISLDDVSPYVLTDYFSLVKVGE